jgi:hypothetical protein
MTLEERFELFIYNEYLHFERIENPAHPVRDICAFLMLNDLAPSIIAHGPNAGRPDNIVACAEHDEIWLNTDIELLEQVVTDEQIRDLVRCGVSYDSGVESLRMNA